MTNLVDGNTTLPPMTEELLSKIDALLDGIDRDESHDDGGWWETSEGARFGAAKLRELKELISHYPPSHD